MGSLGTIRTRIGAFAQEKIVRPAAKTWQDVIDNTLIFLQDRSTAYRQKLGGNDMGSKLILKDLYQFSHFGSTKFVDNSLLAERLRGRQDVILRILEHTTMTPKMLFALYNDTSVPDAIEDEENDNGR